MNLFGVFGYSYEGGAVKSKNFLYFFKIRYIFKIKFIFLNLCLQHFFVLLNGLQSSLDYVYYTIIYFMELKKKNSLIDTLIFDLKIYQE